MRLSKPIRTPAKPLANKPPDGTDFPSIFRKPHALGLGRVEHRLMLQVMASPSPANRRNGTSQLKTWVS